MATVLLVIMEVENTMTRKAILIGGDYDRDQLDGVKQDLDAWKGYLQSRAGGQWRPDEIITMIRSAKEQVLRAVSDAAVADYAIVCFSGHGDVVRDRYGFSCTRAYLDDATVMMEDELNPGNDRCTLFMDCCRHPVEEPSISIGLDSFAESFSLRRDTRRIFDSAVAHCEKGFVKVYAAGYDESAADAKSFTRTLIGVAEEWAGENMGVLTLKEAIPLASNGLDPQQNPVYNAGRRLGHFPFAVS